MLHNVLHVDYMFTQMPLWHYYPQEYIPLKCKHMTLAISMLNSISPLQTKTQNYHLKYPNVLHQISQCT